MKQQINDFMSAGAVTNIKAFPASVPNAETTAKGISKELNQQIRFKRWWSNLAFDLGFITMPEHPENWQPNVRFIMMWAILLLVVAGGLGFAFYWNSQLSYKQGMEDNEKKHTQEKIKRLETALGLREIDEEEKAQEK